jgi:hypothetical protein
MRIKPFPPRGARIGEEDVDAVGVLADLLEQLPYAVDGGRIGGGGDSLGAGGEVGQRVECFAGGFACGSLAGGDEDLGGTGLEESVAEEGFINQYRLPRVCVCVWVRVGASAIRTMTYADAALKPRPREPPVTTATLPLREKSDGKSFS